MKNVKIVFQKSEIKSKKNWVFTLTRLWDDEKVTFRWLLSYKKAASPSVTKQHMMHYFMIWKITFLFSLLRRSFFIQYFRTFWEEKKILWSKKSASEIIFGLRLSYLIMWVKRASLLNNHWWTKINNISRPMLQKSLNERKLHLIVCLGSSQVHSPNVDSCQFVLKERP